MIRRTLKPLILIVIILFSASICINAFAIEFEYPQIVSFIDAIAIDDEKALDDGTEYDIREEWKNNSRIPYLVINGKVQEIDIDETYYDGYISFYGSSFFWLTDENCGFLLLNNFSAPYPSPTFHQWKCSKKENVSTIMEVLSTVYPETLYATGASLGFIITTASDFNNPDVILQYSSEVDTPDNKALFSDSSKFIKAIQNILGKIESSTLSLPIEIGAKGKYVVQIQEKLNELGYDVGKADGDYGNKTKTMIEAFQTDNNIEITGIVDEETYACLFPKVDTEKQTQGASSEIIPKPTTIGGIAPTPTPSQDTTDWAALGEAMKDIDVNGDGYLSMDEIFN